MAVNGERNSQVKDKTNGHVGGQIHEVHGEVKGDSLKHTNLDRFHNKPIHSQRHLKVIVIGAGASGLCFAYKLQRSFSDFTLKLYEKNDGVSGTWLENKYPGYTYSFEPNPDWSNVYASAQEIFQYFDAFKTKYGLQRYCSLRHEVIGATWSNQNGAWDVTVKNLATQETFSDQCDVLISASGILNHWRMPEIPGISSFRGPIVHSAAWNDQIQLSGKDVGLIGNGSSGIQILPALQPDVKKITTFMRSPTWISPPVGNEQRAYTVKEKSQFKDHPEELTKIRKEIDLKQHGLFPLFLRNTDLHETTRVDLTREMKMKINNPAIENSLIPGWGPGCRRLTPGIGYLEALTKPNVELVFGGIESIDENGLVCAGKQYSVDAIVCATGFDTSFRPRFSINGLDNINLQEEWIEPRSYLGLAAPNMPNYFHFLGPNCPIGNGPVLIAIEAQADYMLSFCDRWQTENIHSFVPKQRAVEDFSAFTDKFMERTVWVEDCNSWYKGRSPSGRIAGPWPGSTLHYLETIRQPRYDDWNIEYNGNRFAWLGNGQSQAEVLPAADLGWYIRTEDDGPYLSRRRWIENLTSRRTKPQ
ncbi:hypothetical protein H2200_001491 [Cladophialophora chaetospira]|uniref:Sterigmatocystin biosynthesis monooxygenase stcW n=1 Tax=Cladophialophora chaetospira TaxID=386627 RepID=A0AA39CP42_9EURO|nr:hypothetical protein H2200_001491 [Cladophialophora chaetospira]